MTSTKRFISRFPLLPSPEGGSITVEEIRTEPQPEQLLPPGFEEIVATAAFGYIARLNSETRSRGGQAVLPLTPEGQRRATRIIFDALNLAPETKGLTVIPTKPRELKSAINAGLKLREEEMATGQSLIAQLNQAGKTGGDKPVFFDLGFDKKLIDAATEETLRYPIIPQPLKTRELLALVPDRQQAVQRMAVTAAAAYMAENQGDLSNVMPADEFIARNLEFIRDLLDTPSKQAPVDRGTLAAAAIQLIKRGAELNPTFLEPQDLKLAIRAFSDPKIIKETPVLAAQAAEKLLAHSPDLIESGTAAMEAYGQQIHAAVNRAEKARFSRKDDPITFLTVEAEIFQILPTRPMLGSDILITRAEFLSTAGPDTHHLWENAEKMQTGPRRFVLIPKPEKLVTANAFLRSIQSSDDRLNDDRNRLREAVSAWRLHETEKRTLPDKIKQLDKRIKELDKLSRGKSSSPDKIKDLHPLQLESAILGQAGQISALTRRINQDQAVLMTHGELSRVAKSVGSPDKFAVRFLLYRQRQAGRRQVALEREEGTTLGQEPPFLLTDFPRSLEGEVGSAPETPVEELARIRGYLDELDADKTKPLPNKFMGDRQALWNYLRIWQAKLPAGKKDQKKFMKMSTGISILAKVKGADIGRNFWRSWFIDETKRREHSLIARLERIERYQADKAEMKVIREVLAGNNFNLIVETARRLTASQRSVPLDRWIKMQVVAPDFLKSLKGSGKNDKFPESRLLEQAQKLVQSYRNAKGRIQMRIPHPDQVSQTLKDKFGEIQRYKRKSIQAAAAETIKLLQLAWKNQNHLIPLDISEGATLGELIEATTSRIAVAKATREADGLVAARETARKRIIELKELKAFKQKIVSANQLKSRRDAMVRALKTADFRLLGTMKKLHLAADPEMIPNKPKKK